MKDNIHGKGMPRRLSRTDSALCKTWQSYPGARLIQQTRSAIKDCHIWLDFLDLSNNFRGGDNLFSKLL